ncbi:MFS transporter [Scleromatobacter humisilvae]|uniref:MFS transporter n=1 Tax=Scleromatobacter humisilvae TaxID=2897159 RepID=A0A9X1YN65_9BURK|nr:MFS transporter [Scleromatobacter humisilvae]MCK9689354.1 MFS transporter [Scleromatobacter humisilvae]
MDESAAPLLSPSSSTIARARWGVGLIFFVNGAAFASWVSRIPALRAGLGLSEGALGSVLFAMSCGVLLSFPLAGKGAQLLGARQLALLAGVALLLMLPMPFLIGILPSLVLVMLEVGAALGTMQVAMNVLAVDVQARVPRPIMSSLHGAWSAGGLVGAGAGSLAAHAGLRPLLHLAGAAVVLAGALLLAWMLLLRARLPARSATMPMRPSMSFRQQGRRVDRVLLGLGVICFCAFLSEGALADWSAVWLHDKASASESRAALGYAIFAGAMTTMRMVGDRVLEVFGTVRVLRLLTALGALALGGALLLARVDTAMIAFVLLGLGMATVVPTAFAAAGRRADAAAGGTAGEASAARAVALLSGFGYSGLLLGPPVIGWLAQATTLTWALGLLVLLVAAIVALVPLLGEPARADGKGAVARPSAT